MTQAEINNLKNTVLKTQKEIGEIKKMLTDKKPEPKPVPDKDNNKGNDYVALKILENALAKSQRYAVIMVLIIVVFLLLSALFTTFGIQIFS